MDLTADSDDSSGGAEEAGVGLGDVEGYSSIGEDACGDEVGGVEVAERGGQETGEDPARDQQHVDGGGGDVDGDAEEEEEDCK